MYAVDVIVNRKTRCYVMIGGFGADRHLNDQDGKTVIASTKLKLITFAIIGCL